MTKNRLKQNKKPATLKPQVPAARSDRYTGFFIGAALFALTIGVYAEARQFDFVNYDDPEYVTANPYVRQGVTATGIWWAMRSGEAANWFPLTRISHMLDVQLFGLNSGWHHCTNVLLHALAAILLYAFLARATHARWPSALVAFVFALHPLHVESVAWVAERKDVLSAFFWMLALYAYLRYVQKRGWQRYALVLTAFALGLMAKPMIVTLPFVLLLLDFWPLRRMSDTARGTLLVEKVPLFVLSLAASVIAWLSQQQAGAVKDLSSTPLDLRIENALVSYAAYIRQSIWPSGLAAFYPYPSGYAAWKILLAIALLATCTIMVLRSVRSRPYLATGWFWFLGTLVPVIGLVQVGAQARADRYTYIPMSGLVIMVAWGGAELAERRPQMRRMLAGAAVAACIVLAAVSVGQISYWRDSETLFRHALAVTERNSVAHNNLGIALAGKPERLTEAIAEYQAALEIQPDHAEARNNLGAALARVPGRMDEAIRQYEIALRIKPDYPEAHNNLGGALLEMPGRIPEAIAQLQTALRQKPDYEEAHNNLAIALSRTPGRTADAITEFEVALRLAPDDADAHYNLGVVMARAEIRIPEAITHFETALRLRPDYAQAQQWLDHLRQR
jgi:protein O-mannosyl-transferase